MDEPRGRISRLISATTLGYKGDALVGCADPSDLRVAVVSLPADDYGGFTIGMMRVALASG